MDSYFTTTELGSMDNNRTRANNDLVYATRQNNLTSMQLAIAAGADPNLLLADEPGRPTLLNAFIGLLTIDAVKLLIDSGADVNAKDDLGYTALIRLAGGPTDRKSIEQVVDILIQAGADVNAKTRKGLTALDGASDFALYDLEHQGDRGLASRGQNPSTMLRVSERLIEAGAELEKKATRETLRKARDIVQQERGGR